MLGEAMMLRPITLMADEILRTPALKAKWGEKARGHLELAERTFQKWDSRNCWREASASGLWIVQPFGIDPPTGQWTEATREGRPTVSPIRTTKRTTSLAG